MTPLRQRAIYAAFKAAQQLRHASDIFGGWRLRAGREARWARRWDSREASLAAWRARPGAGRFWISVAGARRWAARRCGEPDLALAEEIVQGRISLLGCEGAQIGAPPRWRRDLYSGREWPLWPASRIPLIIAPGSDIRTQWELSRAYHFVPLAKAYWRTGETRFVEAFRSHVDSWLAQNPPGLGPNWRSPMDAGIRAANWILAALLFAEAPECGKEFWSRVLANLRLTGWFIRRHLEWHPVSRGNHFVANAVGLVYLGAFFADEAQGRAWLVTGARLLEREMEFQVRPDGGSFEASLAYHRLVTELFSFGGEICRRNRLASPGPAYWSRLAGMYRFLAAYLPESGAAPMLGDADDGRLHALCAEALVEPRRHRVGLRPKYLPREAPGSAAFPDAGFFVLRGRGDHAVIRCGPVGLNGAGSHDHNDQLSLELCIAGRRIIADSGTYTYTRSLEERYAFRSTAAHSVPQLGGEEQNPIAVSRPWHVLGDRTRARCEEWNPTADGGRFVGRHLGYAHRPSGAVCLRAIAADFSRHAWSIEDRIEGKGREVLAWRLHFVPGDARLEQVGPGAWKVEHAAAPGLAILVRAPNGFRAELARTRMSDRYGEQVDRWTLLLLGESELPIQISAELRLS